MKRTLASLLLAPALLLAGMAYAQTTTTAPTAADSKHTSKETQEDIQRHRAMAAAHEGAAKCLESGKGHSQCQKELQAACKGLAIGKDCGMRHVH
jgi:hypothetical protein